MRTGINPAKLDSKISQKYHHRIIIPVFIPEISGYFKDLMEVYRLCIESAHLTQHGRSAITVVDNGSCDQVKTWLRGLQDQGVIETLITHGENVGKIDAIIGAARGCREELITLSDSDILFRNGWQEEVEKVFRNFPKAGSVAPFPIARHMYYHSSSTQKSVVTGELGFKFQEAKEPELIKEVYESYGWNYECDYDGLLPIVSKNGVDAVMGSGHQVFTIRRELFFKMPLEPSFIKIGAGSELNWIDKPINELGTLRLSTVNTLVHHMGNQSTKENYTEFEKLVKNKNTPDLLNLSPLILSQINSLEHRALLKIFKIKYDKRPPAPELKVQFKSL
ncbi:glycosyltransferase family 2 protein [Algoriphagus lutimaris]|uniref:glycosyltransferase family A protein n=1 Tax=Algoriphagus lutimaris TaxID=613197 RepID=UPI00196A4245|nr:glycosyltransferase family A protein [Algoriphagus lutimaris]MBN3518706.1 glycosyltransferase family 2 protein [Algoriphagus lutimaris]